MKKLLLALFLFILPTFAFGAQVMVQWGQDPTGVNRVVYVKDPATGVWVSIGSFSTSTDTWTVLGSLSPPGPTTLGGIFSTSLVAHEWMTYCDTTGTCHQAQPAIGDISGWGTGVATALALGTNTSGGVALYPVAVSTLSGLGTGVAAALANNTNATGGVAIYPVATSTLSGLGTGVATALANNTNASGGLPTIPVTLSLLATVPADSIIGNFTGGIAAPSSQAINDCHAAANALTYNTTTHVIGCNTISASGLTFPVTVAGTVNSGALAYFSNATTMNSSAAGVANDVIAWGGAGVAPVDTSILYTNLNWTSGAVTTGDLAQYSGTNKQTSDSSIAAANVNQTTGAVTNGHIAQYNGTNKQTTDSGVTVGQNTRPGGRLTLTSHTPVQTVSVAAGGVQTLYYDSYVGGTVPVYNGTYDQTDVIASNEMLDTIPTTGTGVANANGVFDEWFYDNAGSPVICHATNGSGGGWASDTGGSNTARGTGYSQLDNSTRAYITNKNSITTCYNGSTSYTIAANRGTYLGTFATDASNAGKIDFTLGSAAAGGGAGLIGIWNYYNRVQITTSVTDTNAAYAYSTATIRAADNSTTNRVTFVIGVAEEGVTADYVTPEAASAAGNQQNSAGICADSTSAFSISTMYTSSQSNMLAAFAGGNYKSSPLLGQHFMQACEYPSQGVATVTWNYHTAPVNFFQQTLTVQWRY